MKNSVWFKDGHSLPLSSPIDVISHIPSCVLDMWRKGIASPSSAVARNVSGSFQPLVTSQRLECDVWKRAAGAASRLSAELLGWGSLLLGWGSLLMDA